MDLNESGNIDFRELQRGVMNIPELSEIIAPGRVREAMDTIKRTQGLMTREDFLKFCKLVFQRLAGKYQKKFL